ncbi:MAG: beta-galactosidase [Firmicutes bacterium]|nr:beta-galactosidase [Bacillota bacterium]
MSSAPEIVVCAEQIWDRPDVSSILNQMKAAGVTSVQIYTFWKDFEPNERGGFEWGRYDRRVGLIRDAGLKYVPFILIGPKYASPGWWLKSPDHLGLVCLEHGKESPIDSIWNPLLRPEVERVLEAFAAHYLPWGVLESVQPGICGDYGEAIMPVIGNWPGDYHTHPGYWMGGGLAAASFREWLQARYGGIKALCAAWNYPYASFGEISPFLPHKAPSLTARFDELDWYKDSMTGFVDFWMAACRKFFPDTPVYMCTGGQEEPEHASSFSAQAKACARHGGGVRLTNECNRFFENFFTTSYTHSACEFYGAYLGLEPVGPLTPEGVAARMFGSGAYGNRQIFFYYNNIFKLPDENDFTISNDRTLRFTRYLPLIGGSAAGSPLSAGGLPPPGAEAKASCAPDAAGPAERPENKGESAAGNPPSAGGLPPPGAEAKASCAPDAAGPAEQPENIGGGAAGSPPSGGGHSPTRKAAFFWPCYLGALGKGIPEGIEPIVTYIRKRTDIMPVSDYMVLDGALERFRLLIMPAEAFSRKKVLLKIRGWVLGGGVVFAVGQMFGLELERVPEYDELFGILPGSEKTTGHGAVFTVRDGRFKRFAEYGAYKAMNGWMGLHPDTIEVSKVEYKEGQSGTRIMPAANAFMREYPSGGAALAYFGPVEFGYDPQSVKSQRPVFTRLLADVINMYTDSADMEARPGEVARGIIRGKLYALTEDGEVLAQ